MKLFLRFCLINFVLFFINSFANAKTPEIISSIKPIDSLVRMIVSDEEQDNLDLVVSGNQSPHGFSLKPSDVKKLSEAKIIFYIDDSFEEFLPKILETSSNIIKIDLASNIDLRFFKSRIVESWQKQPSVKGDKDIDYHVWMDTKNAKLMLFTIKNELSKIYPQNAEIYETNYKSSVEKIDILFEQLRDQLKGLKNEKFMVFHDAFQYFENQFNLNNVGYISKNPHYNVSIKSLKQNMFKVKELQIKCVFSDFQFNQKFSNMVAKNAKSKVVALDEIGFNIKPSKDLYFQIMKNAANSFSECLRSEAVKAN